MTLRIRPARLDDLGTICRLRLQRTVWLAARGSDQWTREGRGLPIETFAGSVAQAISNGETWMAEVDGERAGTITVNDRADEGLWSPGELADAVIVHYMIVDLRFAGQRVGEALLAHAARIARDRHRGWVRLDAWSANADLHAYYRRAGFHLARFAGPEATGPSGALFERRTESWAHRPVRSLADSMYPLLSTATPDQDAPAAR
ncbi:GNAT family N-acetyltransferase [Nocardia otitidiscaviarum]|uniref:GNAT family N-acetyltransferase n=1 Tax=Nocardia otitidiscaviarum TaxID=1823 RepID=A0A516NS66_9NOCA|nr:GNAT family N-acetyltransferase [Nocardia otitidiscaviarum]MBF6179651.1 GNAT family N-acetyltransferase [Nocardia otitidiscaviarum]MCP9620984.1 GNAT family N-acetyltransferase [Nocardia otitidiscaviarum]QDP81750.1 GNAT family N-acetyltransferase [Nocardia otitidiscaviarum]